MSLRRRAIFLINLVQDVNVLRPLVFMAARDFGLDTLLLVSTKFSVRDLYGIWEWELEDLCVQTGARFEFFANDLEASRHLVGEGLILAASESHLPNHVTTHSVFRYAPPGLIRVTLQHGFECVGFRHSADHVRAHGSSASFGADLVCSWFGPEHLHSMAQSQLPKLLVTGPTAVLQMHEGPIAEPDAAGIVCENLHSVRLNSVGTLKTQFVEAFERFCGQVEPHGGKVILRPHPGGQYVLKNNVQLPSNATINNAPMFRVDMRRFAYGISAPSSVLIDMVLAGIPTAVWRDEEGVMDAGNYAGLTTISGPDEWVEFARSATADPRPFLDRQRRFLEAQGMPLDRTDVYSRYAELFRLAQRMEVRPIGAVPQRERILIVANANVPTVQLSFDKPLSPLVGRGEIVTELLTEKDIAQGMDGPGQSSEASWIHQSLDRYDPSVIIFSRYSGPGHADIISWARREDVPVIYHIDDDLLGIPPEVGERKFAVHNAVGRVNAVREMLGAADLVYASTEKLRDRLLRYFPALQVVAGSIYCSGSILQGPRRGETRTVGYMASADHAHNLTMVLPAIERLLDRNPNVRFELFGSVPMPPSLLRFGDRVSTAQPVANYDRFLYDFARRRWDVGICPLTKIDFNLMKANTKWVEYTAVGAAVVASKDTVYDESCAGGCGLLADGVEEWLEALELLVRDGTARVRMVERAQKRLDEQYNVQRLREQLLSVIEQAKAARSTRDASLVTEGNIVVQ